MKKGLIIINLMCTFIWGIQAGRQFAPIQWSHISDGIAKRSHLHPFSKSRKVLEEKIQKELEFLYEDVGIKTDKDKKKHRVDSEKKRKLHALLELLNKDCFDEQPLTEKISKLKLNEGLLSWFDRGPLYPHHGGLYRLEQEIERKNVCFHRLQCARRILIDQEADQKIVDKALAVALENFRSIKKQDFQAALKLCMKKGYSKSGCKEVLNGFKAVRQSRRRTIEKLLYDKEPSTKAAAPVLSCSLRFRRCIEDLGLGIGSLAAGAVALIGSGIGLSFFAKSKPPSSK